MAIYIAPDLQRVYLQWVMAEIEAEELAARRNRQFFDGEQGIALTDRQKEYLGDIAGDLTEQALVNICRRAVEIPLERLSVTGIIGEDGASATYATAATEWWKSNQLDSVQYDLFEAALKDGTGLIVAGWDGIGAAPHYELNTLYDGADGQIRLHHDPDTGELIAASKRFPAVNPLTRMKTGKTRLTMYFADRIERFEDTADNPTGWRLLDAQEIGGLPNPQPWIAFDGQPIGIPVVEFDNPGGSELDDVLMPQKAMNKALADLMSAQDIHGFPMLFLQGYSAQILNGKPQPLEWKPGQAMGGPLGSDAKRIEGANLQPMFDVGALGWLQLVSIIKGWPMYLWMKGEPPSGESLKVMESSLIQQVKRKQQVFEAAWRQAFDLGARMARTFGSQTFGNQSYTGTLKLQWADPQTKQPKTDMEAAQLKYDMLEMPRKQRYLEMGYTEEQADELIAMKDEEAQAAIANTLQAAMARQQTFGGNTARTNGQPVNNGQPNQQGE